MTNPSLTHLRARIQPSREHDDPYSYWLIRRVSIHVTMCLAQTVISPNQVTVAAILLGIAAGLLWSVGTNAAFAVGGVLYQLVFVLDRTDGELARYKQMVSRKGHLIDLLGHYLMDITMIIGAAIGLSPALGVLPLYVGLCALLFHLGDELLRDLLYRVLAGAETPMSSERISRNLSLHWRQVKSIWRDIAWFLSSYPGFFSVMLVATIIDAAPASHWTRFLWFSAWAGLVAIKFFVRLRRLLQVGLDG